MPIVPWSNCPEIIYNKADPSNYGPCSSPLSHSLQAFYPTFYTTTPKVLRYKNSLRLATKVQLPVNVIQGLDSSRGNSMCNLTADALSRWKREMIGEGFKITRSSYLWQ